MDAAGGIEPFPVKILSSKTTVSMMHTPVKMKNITEYWCCFDAYSLMHTPVKTINIAEYWCSFDDTP